MHIRTFCRAAVTCTAVHIASTVFDTVEAVPGAGLPPDGEPWIARRLVFFLPVRLLSRAFRLHFHKPLEVSHRHCQRQYTGLADAATLPGSFRPYVPANGCSTSPSDPDSDARGVSLTKVISQDTRLVLARQVIDALTANARRQRRPFLLYLTALLAGTTRQRRYVEFLRVEDLWAKSQGQRTIECSD
ncbi:hypothetical protein CUJ91_31775 (plasmid) [Paraburkholderia graminis]|nr:hypothetical protein CUJ91_31775 [Paraburkholderia graminis]